MPIEKGGNTQGTPRDRDCTKGHGMPKGRGLRDGLSVELCRRQFDLLGRVQGLDVREAAGAQVGEDPDPAGARAIPGSLDDNT